MIVLIGFAILAGAGTALSPCVLPVLPALLSAGGVGGRRRPLGVVLGVSVTFAGAMVGVAKGLEARMSRLAALGPRSRGEGFRSGLLVGAALGFVYTPCAGPILAAV